MFSQDDEALQLPGIRGGTEVTKAELSPTPQFWLRMGQVETSSQGEL